MTPDLPPSPPDAAPQAALVAPAKPSAEPISLESHGYYYVVSGNTLLSRGRRPGQAWPGAMTPKAAAESLRQAYLRAGYLLVGVRAEVRGKLVAVSVIQGRVTEQAMPPSLAWFYTGIEGRDDIDRNTMIRKSALADA